MRYLERFGCAAVAAHWSLLMFAPAFCPAAMAFDPVRAAAVTLVGAAFGAHVLVRARFRPFGFSLGSSRPSAPEAGSLAPVWS